MIHQDHTTALIETDIYSETITCWIKGNNIRGFWENIRQDVKDIIRVLNIPGKESVEYEHDGQKVFIPYEEMLNTLKAGIRVLQFHPGLGLYNIDVLKVLDMFEDRSTTTQVLEEIKKTVRETMKGNIHIEVSQHQNIDQKLNVNTTINLSDSKELQELKSLIEDLKKDSQKNKEWQEDLVKVLSEISAIENASTKEQQKKKWFDVKRIWETMKIFKDAKGLSDTVPWLHDKVESITILINKIGELL